MGKTRSVLVVDDDPALCETLVAILEAQGFRATAAHSADEAIECAKDADFDAVLSDVRMPSKSGIDLIGELRELRPDAPVILMTGFARIDTAVEAMRAGAFDYITKPFNRDEMLVVLARALEHRNLEEENRRLRAAVDRTTAFGDLLGTSPAMHEVFALIRKVADSPSSVLIMGESGTGKGVVAHAIHLNGARSASPFLAVNCSAIPEGLLESELFGHVRGAFTGATASKQGLIERAEGGTLFLDEIGDMGSSLQSKLLRVLQDRDVRRVGSTESVKVDVRIIAATHKNLRLEIEEGRFREDLFYRLNVIPIFIPPLRERPEDVALLAKAFVQKYSGDDARSISPAAIERLVHCRWSGNVRELENVLERTLTLCDSRVIGPTDILLSEEEKEGLVPVGGSPLGFALEGRMTRKELVDLYTEEVLKLTAGNKSKAARILGVDRRTLIRRGE